MNCIEALPMTTDTILPATAIEFLKASEWNRS